MPYLDKIPILGNAFKNNEIRDIRKELLIFVTPRIVVNPRCGQLGREAPARRAVGPPRVRGAARSSGGEGNLSPATFRGHGAAHDLAGRA